MLLRLLEQRAAVTTALALQVKYNYLNLRDTKWELAQNLVDVLGPFESLTRKLCQSGASISQYIPYVNALKKGIERATVDDILLDCKKFMLKGIESRTATINMDMNLALATALDPRYKLRPFTEVHQMTIKAQLIQECEMCIVQTERQNIPADSDGEPPAKKHTSVSAASIDDLMKEMLDDSAEDDSIRDSKSEAQFQVDRYLGEKVNIESDPLEFWKCKSTIYPSLALLARKFLAPPPTSVASERLFSTSGGICSDKRTRLCPDRLESLVFLNKNLKVVDFDY